MFDLLIRNGTVIDGTGAAGFPADVAIKDGTIAAVAPGIAGQAREEIDASGLIVAPGFVDIHTHFDGQVSWDSQLAPSCYHGVTSVVMGNCGVGFAPARPDRHDWLINLLEGVEDIPGTALAEGLTWDWETFPDYLDALDRRQFTMDLGTQMPHAPLRTYVMGDRGADSMSEPSDDEIAEMARLAAEAIEHGALGFSTSRTIVHRTRSGESIGTSRAPERELLAIAEAIGRTGKGVIQLISDAYLTDDDAFAEAELELVRKIAITSGRPVSITVQQTTNVPGRWRMMYDRIEAMRDDGLDIRAQVAVRAIGSIMGFRLSGNPFMGTPTFARLQELRGDERIAELKKPDIRARILEEHKQPVEGPFGEVVAREFHHMFRMRDPVNYEPREENSILAEAQAAGVDPAEFVYDVLLEDNGTRLLYFPALNFVSGDLGVVEQMMQADYALFGLSDAGAHCGIICDASFPTTAIQFWPQRASKAGGQSLEAMIHGYSQRNARHVGWHDRGVVARGYLADLNLIALDELALPPPEMVTDLPAGGLRLVQKARGYRATIKRGVVTMRDGELTGANPASLIRGAQAQPDRQPA